MAFKTLKNVTSVVCFSISKAVPLHNAVTLSTEDLYNPGIDSWPDTAFKWKDRDL